MVPVTLLAHQAPVLPLKRRWPGLDGVALVVGSVVPDLAKATQHATPRWFLGQPMWWDGHSLTQQVGWSLPVGIVLTFLVRRVLAPTLGPYLPDLGPLHLTDLRHVSRNRHPWFVVAGCVLIGSLTHIILDGFTHADGWAVGFLPVLDVELDRALGRPVTVAFVLQVVSSAVLSLVAVREMYLIGVSRSICTWSGVRPTPKPDPPGVVWVRTWALAVLPVAFVWSSGQVHRGKTTAAMTLAWLCLAGWTLLAGAVAARRWAGGGQWSEMPIDSH